MLIYHLLYLADGVKPQTVPSGEACQQRCCMNVARLPPNQRGLCPGTPWSFSPGITLNRASLCQPAPHVVQSPRSPGFAGPIDFFCLCCRRLSPSNCSSTLNTPHINELPRSSYQLTKPPLINRLICSLSWPSISLVAQHIHLIFWDLCSL